MRGRMRMALWAAMWALGSCGCASDGGEGQSGILAADASGGQADTPAGDEPDAYTGAGGGDVAVATGACPFTGDGVCDEPASCAFGTDGEDCDTACGVAGEPAPELWGACAFRAQGLPDPFAVPADLEALGSQGSGGPYGWSHGTVRAKSPSSGDLVKRYYTVYVPDSYDPRRPAPLLFNLPGFGVEMEGKGLRDDINHMAERHGIIVVYLAQHMRDMGWLGWLGGWFVYLEAFAGDWPANPDLHFLRVMKAEMLGRYNIDRSRIYLSGHSRGAGMSIIIGVLASDEFTAVISESGFVGVNHFEDEIAAHEGRRTPMVLVHGKQDDDVWVGYTLMAIDAFEANGWVEEDALRAYVLPYVGHRWQPQLNEEIWEYVYSKQLPLSEVVP